ncbi:DUF6192 family protein [Streptomyces sp. NRRL WC-3742]|uniref:DUF6192 family protein n=1 Tax=Streptomyces sp. NRRL WC-3742 TaxID=1463934 RepID=UPI0004CAB037|nr:DUF6192 family protein [Streptomyces sp. NRRL WC-3742]
MTLPTGYTKSEWEPIVRKGRKLVKQKSSIQFALGDLVIEALEGHPRRRGEVGEVIELLAHQIGINAGTLQNHYKIAKQWPEDKRRADVSYSVHRELAYVRSRYVMIRKDPYDPISKEYRWTENEAQKVANRNFDTPSNRDERLARTRRLLHSDEDAAEVVKEMITRPEVRSRVVADPRSRNILREAQREHWRKVDEELEAEVELAPAEDAEEVEEFVEEQEPLVSYKEAPLEILRLIGAFASFFVSLQRIIPEIHAQDYNEETKAAVLDNVHKARMLLDWCESAVKTGRTDMDKALANLLEDEEGE